MKERRHKCNESNCGKVFTCAPCKHANGEPTYCSARCQKLNPEPVKGGLYLGDTNAGRMLAEGFKPMKNPKARGSYMVRVHPAPRSNATKRHHGRVRNIRKQGVGGDWK